MAFFFRLSKGRMVVFCIRVIPQGQFLVSVRLDLTHVLVLVAF